MSIAPYRGRLVEPRWVDAVVSPAYDALSSDDRRLVRAARPDSYLHVTRSRADEPDGDVVEPGTLLARGRASLERLLAKQVFAPARSPAFHLYRLAEPGHAQIGLVGEIDPHEFGDRALPHEATSAERADFLAQHFVTVGAASSPIACTIRGSGPLEDDLRTASQTTPELDFTADDGLHQTVWRVDDPELAARLQAHLAGADFYIVDGHHRAAASELLVERGHEYPVLVTVFPARSLRLDGFHRLVRLPPGMSEADFVDRIRRRFAVSTSEPLTAVSPGQVGVYADGRWHLVHFDERPIAGGPLITLGSLDPSVLEREVLGPLFASHDSEPDLTYRPSNAGFDQVVVDAQRQGRVPIFVPAVDLDDLFSVADGGLVMPAKSTYFTPKVRSGIFLREY